jgi:AmmeMemoRadiSam system protein A
MMRDAALGHALVAIARNALRVELGHARRAAPGHPALDAPGATFVTLTQAGDLRGCIGSLEASRPLRADVHANAIAAAFRDPRFPPLAAFELDSTQVEVSLLSASAPIAVADEGALLRTLVPGVDGVTLEYGRHRATFLPQVWESLAEPSSFLDALKRKAGLPSGFWHPQMRFSRYAVAKWTEAEFAEAQS